MRISLVFARYTISGVPLAQVRFARVLARLGHEVDLVIGHESSDNPVPQIVGVNVIILNRSKVRMMVVPLCNYLRLNKIEILFSAEDHLNIAVLLAAIISRSDAKISCSSRVTPFDTYSSIPFTKRWFLKILMRSVMSRADALTCVSKDMVEQYRQVFNDPPHVCVYNIIGDSYSRNNMKESVTDSWFVERNSRMVVAAGSLAPWKGFSDLIRAMKIVQSTSKARLVIFGDGPMKLELQMLLESLDLENVVRLFGYVSNPLKYFSHADVFVLSSYVEGLPNVLVEAMMCGCTPVSTDCPTGPREVLMNKECGYLVPVNNPKEMARAILDALETPTPVSVLHQSIEPFSEHEVVRRHFEVLGMDHLGCNAVGSL